MVFLYNIFSETIIRSTTIIVSNINYVKKIVFPLEILPISQSISNLMKSGINLIILLFVKSIYMDGSSWKVVLAIFILIPLVMFTVGLSLIVAALGVYVRDIAYSIGILTNILIYLTPIFYPVTAVPEFLRSYMYINPLTSFIENFRYIIIWGKTPNYTDIFYLFVLSYVVMVMGLIFN